MDFAGLHADVNRILTTHFTPGRNGKSIDSVVLHYNDGDLSIDGCYDTWQTRPASAHYQVQSDGLVGQLVWDGNTAWHAGDWDANCRSIGIEHANRGDSLTDECIESGAHLVAAICVYYKLGRPQWGVNVFPHNHFSSTDCPGPLREGTSYHDRYMARAAEWYDAMASGSQPGPLPGGGPNEAAKQQNEWWDDALGDIRYTGPKMIRAMQAQRGTKEDGVLSGQSEYNRRVVQGNIDHRCYDEYYKGGSDLVRSIQRDVLGYADKDVDGQLGPGTCSDYQTWLKKHGWYSDKVDGHYGANTSVGTGLALKAGAFK